MLPLLAHMLVVGTAVVGPAAVVATNVVNEHPDDPVQAATELLQRVLPGAAAQFELELLPAQPDGAAAMQLGSKGGKVHLLGTGGVELASALNWYLNEYLNATYDWNTYAEGQLPALTNAPAENAALPLPLPETSPVRPRQVPYSYYMNVCTYGYSLAFVPWDYWVKHIDWMALNGINVPLAFVGQEWLWAQVFELQHKCQLSAGIFVDNAEIVEDCPCKTMIVFIEKWSFVGLRKALRPDSRGTV